MTSWLVFKREVLKRVSRTHHGNMVLRTEDWFAVADSHTLAISAQSRSLRHVDFCGYSWHCMGRVMLFECLILFHPFPMIQIVRQQIRFPVFFSRSAFGCYRNWFYSKHLWLPNTNSFGRESSCGKLLKTVLHLSVLFVFHSSEVLTAFRAHNSMNVAFWCSPMRALCQRGLYLVQCHWGLYNSLRWFRLDWWWLDFWSWLSKESVRVFVASLPKAECTKSIHFTMIFPFHV